MKAAERTGSRTYSSLKRNSASATKAMEADMVRSTGRINQALASTSESSGKLRAAAGTGGAVVAAITATAAAVLAAGKAANTAATQIASVGDEAQRAGVSARAFQQWKFVAEQNRIGIDSMIDGLKELSLRADEFVVTGGGPAAEAFERLGYNADELRRKLEDPSALMLEIIGRLGDLDRAAQIRIADEVFGGSAGERFVELIDQGEDGIRRTMERAEELGVVMDEDLIRKADDLNRMFSAVATTVGTTLKGAIVEAAVAVVDFINSFRSFEAQRSQALEGQLNSVIRRRAKLVEQQRELQGGEGLTDNARNLGFGPDAAATKHEIADLQAQIDALTAEEDEIIGVLQSRSPYTAPPEARRLRSIRPTLRRPARGRFRAPAAARATPAALDAAAAQRTAPRPTSSPAKSSRSPGAPKQSGPAPRPRRASTRCSRTTATPPRRPRLRRSSSPRRKKPGCRSRRICGRRSTRWRTAMRKRAPRPSGSTRRRRTWCGRPKRPPR